MSDIIFKTRNPLEAKQGTGVTLTKNGQTGNFKLPAYCANAGAHSPNNNQMNLTPFVFQDMGGTFDDQTSMWRTTDSERNVRL